MRMLGRAISRCIRRMNPDHERKHSQGRVEPHAQTEGHTGEGVVGRASGAYRAKREPSGKGRKEYSGDAVHPYAAPVEVPSHDRHEERRDQRGRRSERVTDEQVRCDDSQQSESGGHEPWCGYRNACELDDSRNGHQEYRGKVCGRGVDRNLAWVAGRSCEPGRGCRPRRTRVRQAGRRGCRVVGPQRV